MPSIDLAIKNKVGLHARPATLFVQEAKSYKSSITVALPGQKPVSARSIISVLSLGIVCGTVITVSAEGEDAEAALAALSALNDRNFDEEIL